MAKTVWLIVWGLAFLGAAIGGVQFFETMSATTAPQQAAGAAMAAAAAIIPYIGARAVTSFIEYGQRERVFREANSIRLALERNAVTPTIASEK